MRTNLSSRTIDTLRQHHKADLKEDDYHDDENINGDYQNCNVHADLLL